MGYDVFKTVAAAKKAYRRARTRVQMFILADGARDLKRVVCPVCDRTLDDDPEEMEGYRGNRCTYHPKTKQVVGFHYVCSWRATLTNIHALADYLL